jgi:plasmid stabilization system protein ParE
VFSQILGFVAKIGSGAAKALTAVMRKARENLATFGELGFAKEGLPIPGMRRLIVGNYLLDYEISDGVILVVAIRHGRQMPPDMTSDDDFDFEQRD